ncbi:MAG TPA: D-2-hydroxyacid dehydrogenase [Dehalococcoidia bacterium]|nr:D-2-hydroxyacid dehydrogenase [Dehalococcoidia bacterium]
MKVAAGRQFFERYGAEAQEIVPDLQWALIEADGTWSESPQDCDLIVLAADAYRKAFVEAVVQIPAPRWAHTEDAGIDGPFYDAMREKQTALTHSPGANAPEVAEVAFSFVLWSAKNLGELRDHQREHRWKQLPLESLSDKTMLIVGLGAIGGRVASYGKAFGMRVLGIRRSTEAVANVDRQGTMDDFSAFLSEADFVVLAIPIAPEVEGMIDQPALALMKPTATLINVGRGALVDVPALKQSLQDGHLRHFCTDVLPTEPWPADDDLWDLPNVLITPHNASSSPLYLKRVGDLWIENLRRYARGDDAMLYRAF